MTTDQPAPRINVGPGGSLDLDNIFTYHPPHGDQVARYAELRAAGRAFAAVLASTVPSGPERSTALARIREAVMWGNAGIACSERPVPALCTRGCQPGREDPTCPAHGRPASTNLGEGVVQITEGEQHIAPAGRTAVTDDTTAAKPPTQWYPDPNPHVPSIDVTEVIASTSPLPACDHDTTAHDYPGGALADLDPSPGPVLDEKAHPRGHSEKP